MRKLFFSVIIFLITACNLLSQERSLFIKTGMGYYVDVFTTYSGPIFWIEGGYTMKTSFNINGRLSMSSVDWEIRDGLFEEYKTILLRQMLDITFSKPFKMKENHFLEFGAGFKLKKEYFLQPDADFVYNSGNNILYTSYSDIFYEIGFTLCLDYYHQFSSGFFMGLRADTNVIWALGFEGLTFSPLFGFRF